LRKKEGWVGLTDGGTRERRKKENGATKKDITQATTILQKKRGNGGQSIRVGCILFVLQTVVIEKE